MTTLLSNDRTITDEFAMLMCDIWQKQQGNQKVMYTV